MTPAADRRNLFGTDGIRDRAGVGMLAPMELSRLGVAIARYAQRGATAPRILCGRDTRVSGTEIERQLGGALAAAGCHIDTVGVLPTPGVSLLSCEEDYQLGIVISASHNPPEFNGVKLFDHAGRKLSVADEEWISQQYFEVPSEVHAPHDAADVEQLRDKYLDRMHAQLGGEPYLEGFKIVLDCARGATATTARAAFERAGATVVMLYDDLDGARINDQCGSLHPEELCRQVVEQGARMGVAFDGDGDRAILVDEKGKIVDGDEVLCLWALDLKQRGELPNNRLVATVMSNAGMEKHLRDNGVDLLRTDVGDREVFAEMVRGEDPLGGEQSGHIIYLPEANTGDGVRTGLHMARLVKGSGQALSELRGAIPRFPQVLLNLPVQSKPPIESLPEVCRERDSVMQTLDGRGRVLLRYSGTEPLVRILVEGPDDQENQELAERIGAKF